ncbi:hypothetical protein GHK92_19605 [Nocardioides sp. dk4132]|uniref:calcium-binding protein n=1 Tax=unclassified Nocardioides TaxID=2615069 RepID=UPI001294AF49|nr:MULTISPECIES: calcium-binding protein [unclassified Nocardioides]MQW78078.1 hypothetical protein [Nocardioides sp. dk4132]QGA08180.1 hypothetical protein GFH29_12780 [Nocardioides sp. dk884]
MHTTIRTAAVVSTSLAAVVAGALLGAGPAAAVVPTDTVIDFTGDAPGTKAPGFVSVATPDVNFRETGGGPVYVDDFSTLSNGQAIVALFTPTAGLDIRLTRPTTGIAMAFGNDNPERVNTTSKARLQVFRGQSQVGVVDVNVNANSTMDQVIRYADARVFDRAVLTYVTADGVPVELQEVVDDITVAPRCTRVGGAGNNVLVGTNGRDVLCGDAGADVIRGGGGADLVYGGPGSDTILAGDDGDWVNGGDGADNIRGEDGADILRGFSGRDRISGGTGGDVLVGGTSRDRCDGGSGRDVGQSCEVRRSIP